MQFPRVNLNGTDKAALLNQQLEMLAALRLAANVMATNAPHGRDYYLIDSDATSRAFAEHMARRKAVDDIIVEIEAIAQNINDQ